MLVHLDVAGVDFIRDGLDRHRQDSFRLAGNVAARWSFRSPAGMRSYRVQARNGTCDGPALTGWTTLNGSQQNYTFPGLPLAVATEAVVAVEGTDMGYLTRLWCSPGAVLADATPAPGQVDRQPWPLWSPPADLADALPDPPAGGQWASGEQMCVALNWTGFTEDAQGIVGYTAALGTTGSAWVASREVGLQSAATICGLPQQTPLYATVCATNLLHRSACTTTARSLSLEPRGWASGLDHVTGPRLHCQPLATARYPGAPADHWECWRYAPLGGQRVTAPNGTLVPADDHVAVQWDIAAPNGGACVARWYVGRARAGQDVSGPVVVPLNGNATRAGSTIEFRHSGPAAATSYHITATALRAQIDVHLVREAPQPPASVGLTFPAQAAPLLPGEADLVPLPAARRLRVDWAPFGSSPRNPMRRYTVTLTRLRADGQPNALVASVPVGLNTTAVLDTDLLASGQRYEVHVHGESLAPGATATLTAGGLFLWDASAPAVTLAAAWQEADYEQAWQDMARDPDQTPTFPGRLCARWSVDDLQSGLGRVVVRWGSSPEAADLGLWDSAQPGAASEWPALHTRAACVGPVSLDNPLVRLAPLYCTLTATNTLGVNTTVSRLVDPVLLPAAGTVTVGCPAAPSQPVPSTPDALGVTVQADQGLCAQWTGLAWPGATDGGLRTMEIRFARALGESGLFEHTAGPVVLTPPALATPGAYATPGQLAPGDAYWAAVRVRNALGYERLVVSAQPAVVSPRVAPVVRSVEAALRCARAPADPAIDPNTTRAALPGPCRPQDALQMVLHVVESHPYGAAGSFALRLVEWGTDLAAVTQVLAINVSAVAAQQVVLPGAAEALRRHELVVPLDAGQAGRLRCGQPYAVEVAMADQFGSRSRCDPQTAPGWRSAPFYLCALPRLTARYLAQRHAVSAEFSVRGPAQGLPAEHSLWCRDPLGLNGTADATEAADPLLGWTQVMPWQPVAPTRMPAAPSGQAAFTPAPVATAQGRASLAFEVSLARAGVRDGSWCQARMRSPEARSAPFLVDAAPPRIANLTCAPALLPGRSPLPPQWFDGATLPALECRYEVAAPHSALERPVWTLGSFPNGTDLLAPTPCDLDDELAGDAPATLLAGRCLANATLMAALRARADLQGVWVRVATRTVLGLAAWGTAYVPLERTDPLAGAFRLQCTPDLRQATLRWRGLEDLESGVGQLEVALHHNNGTALGTATFPSAASAVASAPARVTPSGTARFDLGPEGRTLPTAEGSLCPLWARMTWCDATQRCRQTVVTGDRLAAEDL
ncbi:hypothetical protein PAPYR_7668 [Paratrimastix pyriformis]|uniref:Fibronectin type-III domain-containing protein n=1 Tax=Paratrimastix pyriformis TaxID=342808 RepID=A0ABQ8UGD9_9EUKA|nr:hypothetical protein PAPYR_7668 [Paratrimastix pyriformis]